MIDFLDFDSHFIVRNDGLLNRSTNGFSGISESGIHEVIEDSIGRFFDHGLVR